MPSFITEFWNAVKTKTGVAGVLIALVPFINPWLSSQGLPTLVTTTQPVDGIVPAPVAGAPATLGWVLLGFAVVAVRAAISKNNQSKNS